MRACSVIGAAVLAAEIQKAAMIGQTPSAQQGRREMNALSLAGNSRRSECYRPAMDDGIWLVDEIAVAIFAAAGILPGHVEGCS